MNLKQKNALLIIASIMMAIVVTITISAFFPIVKNNFYILSLYDFNSGITGVPLFAILCSVILILSILFRKDVIKWPKRGLISYGIINSLFTIVIILILISVRSIGYYRQYTNLAIFIFVISIILCVLAFASACLAFTFQYPLSKRVSTREAFAKLRSLKELLDDGIITQEEYEEKRKEYIEGL